MEDRNDRILLKRILGYKDLGLAVTGSALRLAAGFIVRCSELGDVDCHFAVPDSNRGNTVLLPG